MNVRIETAGTSYTLVGATSKSLYAQERYYVRNGNKKISFNKQELLVLRDTINLLFETKKGGKL